MKLPLIVGCISLMGCTSIKTNPHTPDAMDVKLHTMRVCNNIYSMMLENTIDESVDPEHALSPIARKEALKLIDERYIATGTSGKFDQFCNHWMTEEQRQCALDAKTPNGIDLCNKLYPHH